MKRKMFAIMLAALTIFSVQFPVAAANASDINDASGMVQKPETILAAIDADTLVSVKETQILYNLADNPVALMYYPDPVGYIIADDKGRIVQYSLENDNTFFVNPDAHDCYACALGYMEKVDGTYADLTSGNAFTASVMRTASNGAPLTDRISDVANLTALYYLN